MVLSKIGFTLIIVQVLKILSHPSLFLTSLGERNCADFKCVSISISLVFHWTHSLTQKRQKCSYLVLKQRYKSYYLEILLQKLKYQLKRFTQKCKSTIFKTANIIKVKVNQDKMLRTEVLNLILYQLLHYTIKGTCFYDSEEQLPFT